MARPPAGPQGNSPRDVRDDAVGIPAENVTAPEPPRWPPKRKKITKDTFHAKVSGDTSGKRADRAPTFRRGGMVRGYARGGPVAGGPVDKNDPGDLGAKGLKKGGPVAKTGRFRAGGITRHAEGGDTPPPPEPVISDAVVPGTSGGGTGPGGDEQDVGKPKYSTVPRYGDFDRGGAVKKRADGGGSNSVYPTETPEQQGRREARKIISQLPSKANLRSESTENARAMSRLTKDFDTRVSTGKYDRPFAEQGDDLETLARTGKYKDGGKLSAAQRQAMPKSDFALPGKGEGPKGAGAGSYPINNPSHARNALARVSQHGTPAEKATVRAKVKAKYPGIGQD